MMTPQIFYTLGTAQFAEHRFEEACESFRQARELPEGRWNYSLTSLLLKDYDKWPDIDCLCSASEFNGGFKLYEPPLPLWDGLPTDKKVVLLADQGAGDCIIFLRFVEQVKKIVPNVAIKAIKELHSLISLFNVPVVEKVDGFELCYPLMLLPRYFAWYSAPTTYLDPPRSQEISELIEAFAETHKIGICWSGNPHHPTNQDRSVPVEMFKNMAGVNCTFFNLQYGQHSEMFHNVNMMMQDFLDTAQIIKEMDLIITVSTSVSVIAAAMGKPTWVLLDSKPFWLWGLTQTTPWFPSVRMYRQPFCGEWRSPINNVHADLLNKTRHSDDI